MANTPAPRTRTLDEVIADTTSNDPPQAAGNAASAGVSKSYARSDHAHEVRARRARMILAAGTGIYTGKYVKEWVFDKPFDTKPTITCAYEDDGGEPVIAAVIAASFKKNTDGKYISCVIRGWRSKVVPQNLITLLTGSVFNTWAGVATGAVIAATAAEESPVT